MANIYLTEQNSILRKTGDRLIVEKDDEVLRTKIAKTLLDFGDRVQYSVFEAKLDKNLLDKLVQKLLEIISA